MVPSKDEAKKISARLRQASKKFFDDFYAKEAKAGRYPWPHEAMAVLGRILKRATEGEWPPQPPGRPGVCDNELEGLLSPRFFQQVYQVACDAHVRHMPGLQKRAGRPRKDDLAHEAATKEGRTCYRQIAIRLTDAHRRHAEWRASSWTAQVPKTQSSQGDVAPGQNPKLVLSMENNPHTNCPSSQSTIFALHFR